MISVLTARDLIYKASPPWLQRTWAWRLMYALSVVLDGLVDAAVAAVEIRHPNLYSAESLPLLGRERGITRGLVESDDSYAERLALWRRDRRIKGSAVARLRQLRAYLTGYDVTIESITNAGRRTTIDTNGRITVDQVSWNWDGRADLWSRFWTVIHVPSNLWQRDGVWGAPGTWGDGGTWGSMASPEIVATVRNLVTEWRAAHSWCAGVIVVFDNAAWAAAQPDGTWDRQERRNSAAIYWDGC